MSTRPAHIVIVEDEPATRALLAGYFHEAGFLVAEAEGRVVGFVIGEVRDWEFGSPPCGWVFAIDVDPTVRQRGIGAALPALNARSRLPYSGP